jgi:hypothetical protein
LLSSIALLCLGWQHKFKETSEQIDKEVLCTPNRLVAPAAQLAKPLMTATYKDTECFYKN